MNALLRQNLQRLAQDIRHSSWKFKVYAALTIPYGFFLSYLSHSGMLGHRQAAVKIGWFSLGGSLVDLIGLLIIASLALLYYRDSNRRYRLGKARVYSVTILPMFVTWAILDGIHQYGYRLIEVKRIPGGFESSGMLYSLLFFLLPLLLVVKHDWSRPRKDIKGIKKKDLFK